MSIEQKTLLELIQRSRQGDRQAQEELVEAGQNRGYYHCRKMLKKEEDALDATQEVLISMLTKLDTLKEAFKPYCTEVVEVTTAENFG